MDRAMSKRVVILGAGFGGLELSTVLSESGEDFDITLITGRRVSVLDPARSVTILDVATAGVPRAGVFAEGAARIVAETPIAPTRRRPAPPVPSGAAPS
jgi:NADH dehydrogenase FAD-containing subunit